MTKEINHNKTLLSLEVKNPTMLQSLKVLFKMREAYKDGYRTASVKSIDLYKIETDEPDETVAFEVNCGSVFAKNSYPIVTWT